MEQETLKKIKDRVCENLSEYAKRGFSSTSDIAAVKNLLSSYVKTRGIELMEFEDGASSGHNNGGSYRSYDNGSYRSYGNRSYDNGGYDASYRRSYDNSYDHQSSGDDFRQQLERMANNAPDHERKVIHDILNRM